MMEHFRGFPTSIESEYLVPIPGDENLFAMQEPAGTRKQRGGLRSRRLNLHEGKYLRELGLHFPFGEGDQYANTTWIARLHPESPSLTMERVKRIILPDQSGQITDASPLGRLEFWARYQVSLTEELVGGTLPEQVQAEFHLRILPLALEGRADYSQRFELRLDLTQDGHATWDANALNIDLKQRFQQGINWRPVDLTGQTVTIATLGGQDLSFPLPDYQAFCNNFPELHQHGTI